MARKAIPRRLYHCKSKRSTEMWHTEAPPGLTASLKPTPLFSSIGVSAGRHGACLETPPGLLVSVEIGGCMTCRQLKAVLVFRIDD